jgi:hypothetical protein
MGSHVRVRKTRIANAMALWWAAAAAHTTPAGVDGLLKLRRSANQDIRRQPSMLPQNQLVGLPGDNLIGQNQKSDNIDNENDPSKSNRKDKQSNEQSNDEQDDDSQATQKIEEEEKEGEKPQERNLWKHMEKLSLDGSKNNNGKRNTNTKKKNTKKSNANKPLKILLAQNDGTDALITHHATDNLIRIENNVKGSKGGSHSAQGAKGQDGEEQGGNLLTKLAL